MGFTLQQFSEVLQIRDAEGQPYILIGGQAVNYWAEHYLALEPQLESLRPFTSDDVFEFWFRFGCCNPRVPLKVLIAHFRGTWA